MPLVSTDDSSRRLRNVWLGPKGWRFPDARFVAWGVFISFTVIVAALGVLAMPTLRLDLLAVFLSPCGGVLLTRRVMVHVEHDKPVAYYWHILRRELATPRPIEPTTETYDREVVLSPKTFILGAR